MLKRTTKIAFYQVLWHLAVFRICRGYQFGVTPPQITAQTYVLMDYNSGAILTALNPDQRQYPASLTKMMTSYVVGVALKQGKIHNTDMVTIGESARGA